MALNIILVSQICGYVISLILSLCLVIPMTLHQEEFKGHCLLFSTGSWQETGQFLVNWASQAYCNYTIFVGVLLFVISGIQIYRMSLFLYRGTDSSFLSAFVDVIACVMLCLFTLLASTMITYGFMTWCKNMTERFPSCEIAAGNRIDELDGIDTSGFYFELGIAQFGAWASWACWVGLTVFSLLKLCGYHQLENMRVSMFRERQKLINEGMCPAAETYSNSECKTSSNVVPASGNNTSKNAV